MTASSSPATMRAMSSMASGSEPAPRIEIHVNGQPQLIAAGQSLGELLLALGLDPEQVAVERNGHIVPRRLRGEVKLAPGDQIELVTFVGGG